LAFAPGEVTETVDVDIAGDGTYENDEAFSFILSNPANVILAGTPATVTVRNDDPLPQIAIDDPSATEGDAGTTIATSTVSLSNPSAFPITVDHASVDVTATSPVDYTSAPGTLTFAPGETTRTIDVQILGDTIYEQDETFAVDLSSPSGATVMDGHGVVTIVDDDALPVLDVGDTTVLEGNVGDTTASFDVTVTGATQLPVTVDISTADGAATAGSDYDAVTTTLAFAPGEGTKTVDVTVHGDTTFEQDETFMLRLSNPTGATIGNGQGIGSIANDDTAPSLVVADVSVPEGDAGDIFATFTVTLGAPSALPVSLDAATSDDTATQPSDYGAVATSLTFAPGETTTTVDVTIHGDTVVEPDETFSLQLSNAVGASIGQGVGTATIVTDDVVPPAPSAEPTVSIGDASTQEGDAGTTTALTFPVTLSDVATSGVTVAYRTVGGSATDGSDYEGVTDTVRIPAGQVAANIQVTVIGDGRVEPDETFTLEITDAFGARPGSAATGTVVNDDSEATRITLRAKGRHHHVLTRGRMLHAEPGMRVHVVLLKRLGSGYVRIARDTVKIKIRSRGDVRTGIFTTRFTHQERGLYVVRAVFRGDAMHQPARAHALVRL
ncbi:MAG: Calx-beta domain-containing protein, partial [Actinomycetota bacterium]